MPFREQIALGGIPGAGKSSVGEKIATLLGYEFISIGRIRRENLAGKRFHDITIDQLNELEDIKLSLLGKGVKRFSAKNCDRYELPRNLSRKETNVLEELFTFDTDFYVDDLQKKLAKEKDKIVFESRLAYRNCPDAVSFYLRCNERTAAERIFKAKRKSETPYRNLEAALYGIRKRKQSDRRRYQIKYGPKFDCYDPTQFKFVIETEKSMGEVVNEILVKYRGMMKEHAPMALSERR